MPSLRQSMFHHGLAAGALYLWAICAAQAAPAEPPARGPFSEEELRQARVRVELRQLSAELTASFKYHMRAGMTPLLRRLREIAPDTAEAHFFTALEAYEKGEKGRALLALRDATARQADYSRAWNLQGVILSEADRHPEARASFEKAVASSAYNPTYVYNLASVLYQQGEFKNALELARRSIQLKSNLSEGYYLAGLCHTRLKESGPALLAFRQAETFGQRGDRFYLDYLHAAESAGDEKAALTIADQLANSREPPVLRELARLHARYGEFARAATFLGTLCGLREALPDDRKRYVYVLFRANSNAAPLIERLPFVERAELQQLREYYQGLKSGTAGIDARDPIFDPVR